MLHHQSQKTTELYLDFVDEDVKQAADVLNAEFSKSPENRGTTGAQKAEVKIPSYSYQTNKTGRA
jgi:hypothetical protein